MQQDVIQGYRLSPQQQRVWLLQRTGSVYGTQAAIALEGPLAIDVLKEAVLKVITRHEILRTTFSSLPGMKLPVQVVAEAGSPFWRRIDLSSLGDKSRVLAELLTEDRMVPFDLDRGSLIRCTVICLSTNKHFLHLTIPSLCGDSQSLRIITREIASSYEACQSQTELPADIVQYVQFSEWQNELLVSDESQPGVDFWSNPNLTGPVLRLPIEANPQANRKCKPGVRNESIDAEVTSMIAAVATSADVSIDILLLACWQTLLWRLTGEPNIRVSMRANGRVYEEMQEAIGLYEKWLPIHCFFAEHFSFSEIVQQLKSSVNEAFDWQEYFTPGQYSSAGENGAAAATPAIGFNFEPGAEAESGGGLRFQMAEGYSCTERFKLNLSCVQTAGSLSLKFYYDAEYFAAESIKILAGQFKTLLNASLRNAELQVGDLEILGEAEQHQLVIEWNNTASEFPKDRCLPELFVAQVERTPEAAAVVYEEEVLGYRELNRRANQLAHHLRRRGVKPETRVALCLDRSVDMLVAVLGIWKAGGVYVPLDPMQPKRRLVFMIKDAQTHLVLSHRRLEPLLAEQGTDLLYLDSERERIDEESTDNPESNVLPGNLAYIVYTSGSTGQPKGTMIEHRSVVNLLKALEKDIYRPTESGLRISLNAPLAFDSSIKQILQLLAGHTLYILPEEVRRDGDALWSYLQRHKLDALDCTPSQLRLLVEGQLTEQRNSLPRLLLAGGEAIGKDLWTVLAHLPATRSYNVYGPTECTVDATVCCVDKDLDQPSIGRPLANVQTYVLDGRMRTVPIGLIGELYVGGEGLARGYLGRPDLTAEKFLPHPFSNRPGTRLYKTGDVARYLPDGNLEYLGRADNQVKIRGSRIELGEIECVLATHPALRQAVVVARESTPGDKRLVAYLVAGDDIPSSHDLHIFLRERLPDYMLPSAFVILDALPLMPNGKIDRQALPAPEQQSKKTEEHYVAPRSPTESLVAEIWAKVLGLKRVSVEDNFFELGGHSLLATQVISQVRQAFQVEVPLRIIFETPTVAGLSESVEKAKETSTGVDIPPLRPIPRDSNLPLSFAQQRLWFLEQLDPGNTAYNIPYAVRLTGVLNVTAIEQCLSEIVRRHEVLRTTFTMVQGQSVQVIHPAAPCIVTVTDLHSLSQGERKTATKRFANEEVQRPFDLEQGPLLRARLLSLDESEHVLLLTMHHIVFDAWSIGVLMQEVGILYEAFAKGHPSPLPELPVQYADFAHWQRALLQGKILDHHLDYWKTQLAGLATLELPTDRPRPPVQTFKGAHKSFELPAPLAKSLYELSRNEGVTLFMTLLGAFQTLLHRYTAQVDISVGTPIANRNYQEIESLIGFFINTLVLRTNLSGDPSFRKLLQRVRDTALNAYAHQDLPFEKLVEELQPERNLSRTPFFQALFTVRNIAGNALNLPNLAMQGLEVEIATSKFDLLMMIDEREQGINVGFEYNTDLFDHSTISRMAGHFQNLLAGIVATPDCRLSRLSLMQEKECQQILDDWNATSHAYPEEQCIHQVFEQQVELTPDALAVVLENEGLTYRELNRRANHLAHYLKELGVGPDGFAGILMNRSLEMMVSVLAVLKAGGAYVALDPAYPQERLAYMLEDTRARVLLSQKHLTNDLPKQEIRLVLLDADWNFISERQDHNPPLEGSSENLAYVTYTSGSTGKPKGIAMPHRAVRNLLEWQFCETHLLPGARTLQFASLSFDVSFQDMFSTWGSGGTLVLITDEMRRDIAGLSRVLSEKEIHRLFIPAVALQQLAEGFCAQDQIQASLLKVIAGSEQLLITPALTRMFTELPNCSLHNEYGPSETHVVTELSLSESVADWPERPAVGRPIFNTQVYILDSRMEPVPIGVSGELFLGGAGLARGYLNRPDTTAEKFVPDPFSEHAGKRLYRTGDLGRWLVDGQLEFLGRIDFQVKIRGFRVEPGEVEAVLSGHSSVRETVVMAREDDPGNERLVAYIVPAQESAPTISELHSFLRTLLPDYMVPSAYVFLNALPLTPNGKINRRALPAPDQSRPELERAYVAPRTALEATLADCWAEVLGLERVGVFDDFFELGGHSLLATQVIGRLRDVFPIELPLRTLFESPTVADLAERMTVEYGPAETLEDIARTLQELAELSEGEVETLLIQERLSAESATQ